MSAIFRMMIQFICLTSTLFFVHPAFSSEPVTIGVLAFRPKPQTLAQWQPLADSLKRAIPERDFVVETLTFPELEAAVATHQVDFVLTNPGHYVLMAKRIGLSTPLATLAVDQNGQPLSVYGGVIFSRHNQANINTFSDIKGKAVAVASTDSLGSYQMEAYELIQAGIRFPQEAQLITTGMPQDNVVEAVLSGRADVGFVRTGVLEDMAREGKLDMKQIKCINPQNHPNFPLQVSTRLYPEWAFAVLPHVDGSLARHVAAALYVLEDNAAAVRVMKIHGFVVPPDYTPVADLLKELRLPPFDVTPKFTMLDIFDRYRWQVVGIFLASVVIMILGFRLLLSRRKLAAQHQALQLHQQLLQESDERLHLLNESLEQQVIEQTKQNIEKERLLIEQSRSASMGEMIRNIAHQWRQPLNTVGLVVQNIREDYREQLLTQEELDKDIDVALQCVKSMSQTIDDFRNFFRNDKEKMQFNLHQAIAESLGLIEATLKNRQINVSISGDTSLQAIGYIHEFSQVILNLLANAKDALIDNKVPNGRIEIELISTDEARMVLIRDNAGGIPKEIEGRVFEPYFTTKIDGSGIGLYMSKIIIEKHMGGSITYRNTKEGAEFTVSIPLRPNDEKKPAQ